MDWKRLLTIGGILLLTNFGIGNADTAWIKYSYFNNIGGLNDQLSATEIQDNEASDIQNIVFDTGGAIKKRYGYNTIPNAPIAKSATGTDVEVTGLAYYTKNNGNKYVVATDYADGALKVSQKTYQAGGGLNMTTGWTSITGGVPPTTGYSVNYLTDFTIANDFVVFSTNNTSQTKPFKWNATGDVLTLTADANCPPATIVKYHKNILFVAGDTNHPSRITFSNLGNMDTWTATDFFEVNNSDGTIIRGMISAFNSLYIFKDKSIWRLSGSNRDDFILEKMVDGIGTLSQQSIAIVNNSIVFTTAQNDIAVYDGAYGVVFISQKIRNTIGSLNFSRATNALGIAFSAYRYNDYDYYSSVSNAGSATNNRVLFFDTAFKAWSKFVGINANAWCVGTDSLGQNILIFGDYSGYVHLYSSASYYDGDVATSSINAFYQTKWFKYSDIALGDKYWRLLRTYALSESSETFLTIEAKADYQVSGTQYIVSLGQGGSLWDVAVWDVDTWVGSGLIVGRNEINKGKNMFQIKFSNNTVNKGFTILGWENYLESTGRI